MYLFSFAILLLGLTIAANCGPFTSLVNLEKLYTLEDELITIADVILKQEKYAHDGVDVHNIENLERYAELFCLFCILLPQTLVYIVTRIRGQTLTLNAPIATKVACFSRLLKCLRSLYGKQCGPRSDCSYGSSLFWVHTVCFYT